MNQFINHKLLIKPDGINMAYQKLEKQYFIAVNPQYGRVVVSLIAAWETEEKHAELKKIYITHEAEMDQAVERIARLLVKHPAAKVLINSNGKENILAEFLEIKEIPFKEIQWGGTCFLEKNHKLYVNKRAQAYVCLSRAIQQGRFKFKTKDHKELIIEQLSSIFSVLDEKQRFKVLSVDDMRKSSMPMPDISDTLAYVFLESIAVN